MKFFAVYAVVLLSLGTVRAADEYRQLLKVNPLPTALDHDFQFRKTKLFLIGYAVTQKRPGKLSSQGGALKDPSIDFERTYRIFGAVTALDQRRLYGDYMDFFWRAKRPATITVRLEYRPEALRVATQAREVTYPSAKGNHKTSFAIIGDDFITDGRILSWRCLLIEKGRIVAETKSFLWR